MRVLELVTSSDWGGAQAQVLLIAKELLARGHDVHVAAGGGGELLQRAQAAGATVHPLKHLTGPVLPHRDLLALRELIALLGAVSPDILHTHSAKAGVLGRTAAAARARVGGSARITAATSAKTSSRGRHTPPPTTVVHTSHGLSWGPGRRQGPAALAFKAAEGLTGRWCDHVICVSEDLHRSVTEQRLYPRARCLVIHNGIDIGEPGPGPFSPGRQAARLALGLPPEGPLLVLVGRLVLGKGHSLALEAVAELAQGGVAVSIAFAGDGPLRAQLEAAAEAARSAGAGVVFLGHRADVPVILRSADVLIAPSSAEGLSLAAIEGMSAALPVVASNIPGLREVVLDGVTGLLFDLAGGPSALQDAIRRLLADPFLARQMGLAGRERVETRFSLHNTSRTADFLDDIIRCPEAGQPGVSGGN